LAFIVSTKPWRRPSVQAFMNDSRMVELASRPDQPLPRWSPLQRFRAFIALSAIIPCADIQSRVSLLAWLPMSLTSCQYGRRL
jgi:hypothetical protein